MLSVVGFNYSKLSPKAEEHFLTVLLDELTVHRNELFFYKYFMFYLLVVKSLYWLLEPESRKLKLIKKIKIKIKIWGRMQYNSTPWT